MLETRYPSRLPLRLDWSEMDMFGHINNVSYFKFMQAGRVNYWERCGMASRLETERLGPILAESTCRFIAPLFYPGMIEVQTGLAGYKTSSFTLVHRIYDAGGNLCAEGRDVIVWYNFATNQKQALTESDLEAMMALERGV